MKIGIDGGGTKTECIMIDARGRVVARHTAPGCNPNITGPERARGAETPAEPAGAAMKRAPHGGPGLVLLAGNGSCVAARDTAGKIYYAGGLGWRLGDPG